MVENCMDLWSYTPAAMRRTPSLMARRRTSSAILMAAIANMGLMVCGCAISWPSPAHEAITGPSKNHSLSEENFSWYTSSIYGTAIVGTSLGAVLSHRVGCQKSLLLMVAPIIVSWTMKGLAPRGIHVLVGQLLAGVTIGMIYVVTPIYTERIADECMRVALGAFFQVEFAVGTLLVYLFGRYMTLEVVGWICLGVTIIYFILFVLCNECPPLGPAAPSSEALHRLFCCGTPDNRAFTISALMVVTAQGGGVNMVIMNALEILNAATEDSTLSPEIFCMVFGAVMIAGSCVSPFLVDKMGRRPLLLISCFGEAICMTSLAIYMYFLRTVGVKVSKFQPIFHTLLLMYVVFFCIGLGPVTPLASVELFSADVRHVGSAAVAMFGWMCCLVMSLAWYYLKTWIGWDAAFGASACVCVIGGVVILLFLPETRTKTSEEIQNILKSKQRVFLRNRRPQRTQISLVNG